MRYRHGCCCLEKSSNKSQERSQYRSETFHPPLFGHQMAIGTTPAAPTPQGDGPFEPDDVLAAQCRDLTQYRKCGWFNRFSHRNFRVQLLSHGRHGSRRTMSYAGHSVGSAEDWCHSCGRIASAKDFSKLQAKPYELKAGDIFLGERLIPFRIVAHDPRQLEQYQARWASQAEGSDPRWTFTEAEMEKDVFNHRFGKYPRIEVILESIPSSHRTRFQRPTAMPNRLHSKCTSPPIFQSTVLTIRSTTLTITIRMAIAQNV